MAKTSRSRNRGNLKAFGENLQRLRLKTGLSQEELADRAGVAFTTINRLENGNLNTGITTLFDLAKGLDVKVIELFDY